MKWNVVSSTKHELNSSAEKAFDNVFSKLDEVVSVFSYSSPESFLSYVFDDGYMARIEVMISEKRGGHLLKTVFVVGIGGANLAAKAIYDAHTGFGEGNFDSKRKMVFLDTIDEELMASVALRIDSLQNKEELIVVITVNPVKPIETLANAEFLLSRLEQKFSQIKDRVIVVSSSKSPLFTDAEVKGITTIELPEVLSDRFSAFSPTTLVPLGLFGFPVADFLHSARHAFRLYTSTQKAGLVETVLLLDNAYKHGSHILDLWFFSPHFETLGKWQKQLVAESLGKSETKDGNAQMTGFTPTVSIGTTDLHSSLQLTLGGPKERITSFVMQDVLLDETIGDAEALDVLSEKITSQSPHSIVGTILSSVMHSYKEANLPYISFELPANTLEATAQYMMYTMIQTCLLGQLWNVNVFNQPNVEDYKTEARESLESAENLKLTT